MESRELAKIAYNALDEKKGINISIIDISESLSLSNEIYAKKKCENM